MVKRFFLALIIGVIATLFVFQHDQWLKKAIADRFVKVFECANECTFFYKEVSVLGVFSGRLVLRDVIVTPVDGSDVWSWKADRFSIRLSWYDLLMYGTLDLRVFLENLYAESRIEQWCPAIERHVQKLMACPEFPLSIIMKSITLKNASFVCSDPTGTIDGSLEFDVQAKRIDEALCSTVHVRNGSTTLYGRTLYQKLNGELQVKSYDASDSLDITVRGSVSFEIPQFDERRTHCFVAGSWNHTRGSLSIKNADRSFVIEPIVIAQKESDIELRIDAELPLSYLVRLMRNDPHDSSISGDCSAQLRATINNQSAHGHLVARRVSLFDTPIASLARITFNKNNDAWSGFLYAQRTSGVSFGGSWHWHEQNKTGKAHLSNHTVLAWSPDHHWQILPENVRLDLSFNDDFMVTGSYACNASHTKLAKSYDTHGKFAVTDKECTAQGFIGTNAYHLCAQLKPEVRLTQVSYTDQAGQKQIDLHQQAEEITGTIDFELLRTIAHNCAGMDLQGEGDILLHLATNNGSRIAAQASLSAGTIRLPGTYNFINGFNARVDVDLDAKEITVDDLCIALHKGRITSSRSRIHFDDRLHITHAYVPLLLQDCLLNIKKDLFGIISANCVLTKKSFGAALLRGALILERSQLKENLFSDALQQRLFNFSGSPLSSSTGDINLDLSIITKDPVRVKTAFLETNARVNLQIKKSLYNPEVSGKIDLSGGQLSFPYKPLHINKGSIYFLPQQLHDPLIELIAKNKIKKYHVNMHVSGSLQNQHVSLDASPPLTEEQIIALLLVGSQEESLGIVMPALIMQNIKTVLFGSDQTEGKLDKYFGSLLKPLKHVTLVPSFVDQTGRGGLRGAIEINVDDRWRALIQKNFSLTEDTRFEVEYLLSDEVTIRGVRDERRDLSAEVEMRWKFGN